MNTMNIRMLIAHMIPVLGVVLFVIGLTQGGGCMECK